MDFLGESSKRFGDVCDVNVIFDRAGRGPNIVFHITLEGIEETGGMRAITQQKFYTNTYLMQQFCEETLQVSKQLDELWMRAALIAAHDAKEIGEVPIGACIVDEHGQLQGSASNRTIIDSDPTAHAEILVIRHLAELTGNYRLSGATVYTTIEPCVMCAGALVNSRVKRLVFGAHDERFGAVETLFRLCDNEKLNHRMEITSGVLADECRALMQEFFRSRR